MNRLMAKRHWVSESDNDQNDDGLQFRMLSYNILAQNLLEANPQLYRNINRSHLIWANRWSGIQEEVLGLDPDIVCLQEVQFKRPNYFRSEILPFFESHGFRAIFKCRTGDKQDGCAIFYKMNKFKLDCYSLVEYSRPNNSLLDRDNIGIVCRLVPRHRPELPNLVVATTHLLFNRKRADIRLSQLAIFLAELDKFSNSGGRRLPTVISGDFNSDSESQVYRLLSEGQISYVGARAGSRAMPRQLIPMGVGVTDTCQWEQDVRQLGAQVVYGTGSFSHNFNFKSVHQEWEQPEVQNKIVSTNHGSWVIVDFVFYTHTRAIKLLSRLLLPKQQDMDAIGHIPSDICPSDHFPLVSDFMLLRER